MQVDWWRNKPITTSTTDVARRSVHFSSQASNKRSSKKVYKTEVVSTGTIFKFNSFPVVPNWLQVLISFPTTVLHVRERDCDRKWWYAQSIEVTLPGHAKRAHQISIVSRRDCSRIDIFNLFSEVYRCVCTGVTNVKSSIPNWNIFLSSPCWPVIPNQSELVSPN